MKNPLYIHLLLISSLFFIAICLPFYGMNENAFHTGDEAVQVPAAKAFVASGHTDGTFWHHPPFGLVLLAGSVEIAGDNPYGWRIRNILLGGLAVIALYLIGWELFHDRRIAFLASLFLTLDPLYINLSRSTFDEIPALFFFLLAFYAVLRSLKGGKEVAWVAGVALGLSLASKPYYYFGLAALFVFTLLQRPDAKPINAHRVVNSILIFLLVPAAVFSLTYLPWFMRGYDVFDFFRYLLDSYSDLKSMTGEWFRYGAILKESGHPIGWFIVPRIFGFHLGQENGWSRFLLFMNNPPVWLLAWPALMFMLRQYLKNKNAHLMLCLALFCATYFPLLVLERPIFIYSAITVLPFVFLPIAYLLNSLINDLQNRNRNYAILLTSLVLWSAYLYPLATGKNVQAVLYAPITSHATIFR